jgi:hypothetical protein
MAGSTRHIIPHRPQAIARFLWIVVDFPRALKELLPKRDGGVDGSWAKGKAGLQRKCCKQDGNKETKRAQRCAKVASHQGTPLFREKNHAKRGKSLVYVVGPCTAAFYA